MCRQVSLFLLAAAAAGACCVASQLRAADIQFSPPTTLTGTSSDFSFTGTLDRAYALGVSTSVDALGITFTPLSSNSIGDSTTLDHAFDFSTNGVPSSIAKLVSRGMSHDGGTASITLHNLIPGDVYTADVIGMGLRVRTDCCEAGAGYTNLFVSGDTSNGGTPVAWDTNDTSSRMMRGTFTADASGQQTIYFNKFGTSGFDSSTISANVSAVLLSVAAVPEPTTLALAVLGVVGCLLGRRR
jgi:hypothetical protein